MVAKCLQKCAVVGIKSLDQLARDGPMDLGI